MLLSEWASMWSKATVGNEVVYNSLIIWAFSVWEVEDKDVVDCCV
jgi:hypothetical protein